jgi:hypothetical protein
MPSSIKKVEFNIMSRINVKIIRIFMVFFITNFIAASIAKDVQSAEISIELPINITALFLAGMDLPPNNNLEKFTQTTFYKSYKTDFSTGWERFQKPNLDKMRNWWQEKIALTYDKDILYPFSGPDIMNVLTFFPDGDTYIMFGLEPVGTVPIPYDASVLDIINGLKSIRKSLNTIFSVNFFKTIDMTEDIKNNSFSGISALLMVFLVKCGYTIIDAKNIIIDNQSTLVSWETSDAKINWQNPPASQRIPGIEVSFKKGNGKTQVVRYFNLNVIDENLKKLPNFIQYITKNASYATMLKSASYLMHNDNMKFTKIRAAILDSSDFIIQDDSGIPIRYFKNNKWAVSLHGVYNKPISLFANKYQLDLKEAYKLSTGILPFSYGYDYKKNESNLLAAKKIKTSD